jgi:hypothetical protein
VELCIHVVDSSVPISTSIVFSASIATSVHLTSSLELFLIMPSSPLRRSSCSVPSTAGSEVAFFVASVNRFNFILGSSDMVSTAGSLKPSKPSLRILPPRFYAPVSPLEPPFGDLLDDVAGEVVRCSTPCHAFFSGAMLVTRGCVCQNFILSCKISSQCQNFKIQIF